MILGRHNIERPEVRRKKPTGAPIESPEPVSCARRFKVLCDAAVLGYNSPMDLSSMRQDYRQGELRRGDLKEDPFQQFQSWFDEACQSKQVEPNAVSLATADAQGRPLLRTVLVKQFDARGFVFFTNLESRKARHIEENAMVSMLFPWIALERQVIVCGRASKIPLSETMTYFATRPLDSQIGAWASKQSAAVSSRKVLEMQWETIKRKFADGKIPVPAFWGGFRVVPDTIEFWQGRSSRLHDRFLYTRGPQQAWSIERLSP